jgi:hypothetical protein
MFLPYQEYVYSQADSIFGFLGPKDLRRVSTCQRANARLSVSSSQVERSYYFSSPLPHNGVEVLSSYSYEPQYVSTYNRFVTGLWKATCTCCQSIDALSSLDYLLAGTRTEALSIRATSHHPCTCASYPDLKSCSFVATLSI